ncbi:hypothetical protein CLOSTHATH_00893 [Hungatella hathewayi DSM 13479]|uniref:Uncharacterized protein n=1 Tax=Hungatella hathewayi DSM 13479 TaxID=566550 RepID=D3ABC0_9FIRM|nr:hypothetical protein CLOSTHATH_00893 [Hungatella hathewayi DSM 13479]
MQQFILPAAVKPQSFSDSCIKRRQDRKNNGVSVTDYFMNLS